MFLLVFFFHISTRHENEKQHQWFNSRQKKTLLTSVPCMATENILCHQSYHFIYQYSTKLFLCFLATWNLIVIKNCTAKTQLMQGWILRPPDTWLIGSKHDGSGFSIPVCYIAAGLQGLKWPLFCQEQPTPSLSEACTSIRVAVHLLD